MSARPGAALSSPGQTPSPCRRSDRSHWQSNRLPDPGGRTFSIAELLERGFTVITNYDLILRSRPRRALAPDLLLRFGVTPVSKAVLGFLVRCRRDNRWPSDRAECRTIHLRRREWCSMRSPELSRLFRQSGDRWRRGLWSAWQSAATAASDATARTLAHPEPLRNRRRLSLWPPSCRRTPRSGLQPVCRCVTWTPSFPSGLSSPRLGNRGVNGIDGVVVGTGRSGRLEAPSNPVNRGSVPASRYNGLLISTLWVDATIVLVNNDGGGIFHFLPQSAHGDVFGRFFTTPTGIDFQWVAAVPDRHRPSHHGRGTSLSASRGAGSPV